MHLRSGTAMSYPFLNTNPHCRVFLRNPWYFYEFKPLRSLLEIRVDILALEESSLELEKEVLN